MSTLAPPTVEEVEPLEQLVEEREAMGYTGAGPTERRPDGQRRPSRGADP